MSDAPDGSLRLAATKTDLPGDPSASGYRWYVLALLTLAATLNNIDKNLLPALAEPIKQEFGLSDSQFGLVVGLVYSLGFIVAGVPIGFLIDRVNRSRLLALLLLVWSGATTLGAFVNSYIQLVLVRVVVGGAESGGTPTSMALIADWFRQDRRGTALGIWTISRSISLVVSFAIGGFIAVHLGWRSAFLIAGLPGVLLSLVIFFTMRDAGPTGAASTEHLERSSFNAVVRALRREKSLLLLAIAAVLGVACQNGLMAFMSAFLSRIHHLPVDRAGLAVGVILGAGAGIGMPLGGIMMDLIAKRRIQAQFAWVASLMIAGIPVALAGLLLPKLEVALAGLFLFELLCSCAYTAVLSAYLNAIPAGMRGAFSSFITLLVIFLGSGLGPLLAGVLSDFLQSAQVADPLRWALSLMTCLLLVSGALVVVAGRMLGKASPHR